MTLEETTKLLTYLECLYVNQFNRISEDGRMTMIQAWHTYFRDYPASAVMLAAERATRSSPQFVPSAPQICNNIYRSIEILANQGNEECLSFREGQIGWHLRLGYDA